MQCLYVGNLKIGMYEVIVFVEGIGLDNWVYKQVVIVDFEKDIGIVVLEICIQDWLFDYQFSVLIMVWD